MISLVLRQKCPYCEVFWSILPRIWTECGEILRISPYSVQMQRNTDQKTLNTDTFHAVLAYLEGLQVKPILYWNVYLFILCRSLQSCSAVLLGSSVTGSKDVVNP